MLINRTFTYLHPYYYHTINPYFRSTTIIPLTHTLKKIKKNNSNLCNLDIAAHKNKKLKTSLNSTTVQNILM